MMPEMRRFHEAVDYSLVALPARCSKPVAGFPARAAPPGQCLGNPVNMLGITLIPNLAEASCRQTKPEIKRKAKWGAC